MMVFDFILGVLMVLAGRNLFWLCVGIVGFLVGVQCASALGYSSGGMALIAAIALGGLGALLAISFEWLTVVFGVGFLGGGYLLTNLLPLTAGQGQYVWSIFVVGGILGMCFMVIVFDWTLIMISSLLGAVLIVNSFHTTEEVREILFIICVVTGILVQYLALREATSSDPEHSHSANVPADKQQAGRT